MVEAVKVHPFVQLQCFHTIQQLATWMCLKNDISFTSSVDCICSNIYLFTVVITHVMHIHSPSDRLVLTIKCCCLLHRCSQCAPTEKINTLVCRCKACCLQSKKSNSMLHFSKFHVNPNFNLKTNCIFRKHTNRCYQRYIVWMEILSNFLTSRIRFWYKWTQKLH